MKYTDKLVVGTDSLASNSKLDIIEEIKTIHKNVQGISVAELLKWSTINGARALHIDDEVGSFEKGKQPGIVVLNGIDENNIADNANSYRLL
jgi:cytosine/adenosine deaminase-related metal-dependent hydrolase